MASRFKTIIYPVRDLASAKALYRALLGVDAFADEPYYVGFMAGDQQIGLDPQGHTKGMTGPLAYCHVDDIQASLKQLLSAGATAQQEVSDVGWGQADGNSQRCGWQRHRSDSVVLTTRRHAAGDRDQ